MENAKVKILAIGCDESSLKAIGLLGSSEIQSVELFVFTVVEGFPEPETLQNVNPDVILLDAGGENAENFSFSRKIKKVEHLKAVPVIFLIANDAGEQMYKQALDAGADSFISKPVNRTELMLQVQVMYKLKCLAAEKDNEKKRLQTLVDERTQELNSIHIATLNLLEDLKNEVDTRRKTELALRDSEARLMRAELASKSGNWELDLKAGIVVGSKGASVLYGLPDGNSFSYDIIRNFCLPEYRDRLDEVINKCIHQGDSFELEYKIKQSGTGAIVDIHVLGFYNRDRGILFGVINDITEERKAKEALRASEELYRSIIYASPDSVIMTDLQGDLRMVSPAGLRTFGYADEREVVGRNIEFFLCEEELDKARLNIGRMFQGEYPGPMEYTLLKADGTKIFTEINAEFVRDALGEPMSMVFTVRDNTERKDAQRIIAESESLYRAIVESSPDYIVIADLDGNILKVSSSVLERLKLENEEQVTGLKLEHFIAEEDRERMLSDLQNRITNKVKRGPQEYKITIPSGEEFDFEISVGLIYDNDQNVVRIVAISRDITERKRIQDALRQSEERYNTFINNNEDLIYVKDNDLRYLVANRSLANVCGLDVENLVGRTDLELFGDREAVLNDGVGDALVLRNNCLMNAEEIWADRVYETARFPMNIGDGFVGIGGIMHDITKRKSAEQRLNYVTRLYALLSHVNQMIVRAKSEEELFENVTQLSVEYGRFMMCWIGIYDVEAGTIVPLAFAGNEEGYLDNVVIDVYPLNNDSNGPAARCAREGVGVFYNDIQTTTFPGEWSEKAIERGYRSVFATRLMRKGKLYGTLAWYAAEVNFFHEEERRLLQNIAEDITYALEVFDSETERQETEIALKASEAKYRDFVEYSPESIAIYQNNKVLYVNQECLRMMHASSKADLIGADVLEFIHPDNLDIVMARMEKLRDAEIDVSFPVVEEKYIRLDGTPIYVEVKAMPIMLDGERAIQLTARDISGRKHVEEELEQRRIELKAIYDNAPVMMCVVDENRNIYFANNAFTTLNGKLDEPLRGELGILGNVIGCFSSKTDPRGCGYGDFCADCSLKNALEDTFQSGVNHSNIETRSTLIIRKKTIELSLLGSTAIINSGNEKRVLLCLHDITDRKRAEEALQKSEMLLRTFIDNSPFEIWARDNDGVGILENRKLVDHFGSIVGSRFDTSEWNSDEEFDLFKNINERAYSGDIVEEEFDVHVTGLQKSYQQIVFPIRNSERIIGVAGFNIDITEKKLAQEALKQSQEELAKFAAHLQNVREEERSMLAREIHDDLGQILIAMKIDIGLLRNSVLRNVLPAEFEQIRLRFVELQQMVDNTLSSARRIMTDLRPEVLDLLGLGDTVAQYLKSFNGRYHIECEFHNGAIGASLNAQESVALYRIVQEAMNNVAKHAKATKVIVRFEMIGDEFSLTISDDGVGFDAADIKRADSYGLLGIKERAVLLNGQLDIVSSPGAGVHILLKFVPQS